jgi:hypothetical protein
MLQVLYNSTVTGIGEGVIQGGQPSLKPTEREGQGGQPSLKPTKWEGQGGLPSLKPTTIGRE